MNNNNTFITVRFRCTQLHPILIDIADKLQTVNKIDFDFIISILDEEFELQERKANVKFLSSDYNAYIVMDKDFEMSKKVFSEKGLNILINYKKAAGNDLEMQLKTLKIQFKQDLTKLENRLKNKFMLYDCLLLHKTVDNNTYSELIDSFYAPEEKKKLYDILEKSKSLKLNNNTDNNISDNILSLSRQLSTLSLETRFEDEESILDFGILYSEPLVTYDRNNQKASGIVNGPRDHQPVDFIGECNMILNTVKELNNNLSLILKCLTTDSLLKLINARPKILHLICHGDIDAPTGEYYLECENHRAELLPLGSLKLKELLRNNENISKIKLLFINACHSQQIAQLFLDLGVECVVSIQKDSRIVDHISKDFAQYFFSSLLNGTDIEYAFNKAIQLVTLNYTNNENAFHSCCCAHLHKEHCSWYLYARENGTYNAHLQHVPKYPQCKCPKAYKNTHRMDCIWATKFILQFMNDDMTMAYEKIENQRFICCCSPELPHNETMKFKIMYKNNQTALGKSVIFPKTIVKNHNKHLINNDYFGNKQFFVNKTIGFNRYLYKMYNYFLYEEGKVALIKGEKGCGKSLLVKHFANYCKERKKFDYVKLFEFEGVNYLYDFASKINSYLDSEKLYTNKKGNKPRNVSFRKILLILDDLDDLINKDINVIIKTIQNYIEKYNIHFIITVSDINKTYGFYFSDKMLIQIIEDLPLSVCAKIFLKHCQDQLPQYLQNYNILSENDNFKECFYNIHRYPKHIIELANLINNGFDLDQILHEYKKINNMNNNKKQDLAQLEKNSVIYTDISNIKFIGLLGRLSSGLIFEIDFLFYLRFIGFNDSERIIDFLNSDLNKKLNLKNNSGESADNLKPLYFEKKESGGPSNMDVESKYTEIRNIIWRILCNLNDKVELTYFTFTMTKLGDKNYIKMSRNYSLADAIENINDERLYFDNMCSLINFVTCELSTIICNHKRMKNYFETDISFSSFSYHPNWTLPNLDNKELKKLKNVDSNYAYMQNLFNTFIYILKESNFLDKLFDTAEKYQLNYDFFYSHIEDFLIKLFSILQSSPYDKIIEFEYLVPRILKSVNRSEKLASRFLNLQVKLHILMTVALIGKYKAKKSSDLIYEIKDHLNSLDSLTCRQNLSAERDQELLIHKYEVCFLKIRVNKILADFNFEKAIEYVYNGLQLFEEQGYMSLILRTLYQVGKYKFHKNKVTEILALKIKKAIEESKEDQDIYLRFKLCLLLNKMYINHREKSIRYYEMARDIAEKMKFEEFMTRIAKASENYITSVADYHEKRFAILVSSPLINESSEDMGGDMVDFKPYLKLKNKLCDIVHTLQKSIYIDYERMTLQNIKKYLTEMGGCKMLLLYFNYSNSEHLILENSDMSKTLISYNEFVDFISELNIQTEILILVNIFGNNTFVKNLNNKFQRIIYFEFNTRYKIKNAIWLKKLTNIYVIKFCTEFFYEIFKGEIMMDAYREAKTMAEKELEICATQKFKSLIKVSTDDKRLTFKELRIIEQVRELCEIGVCIIRNKNVFENHSYYLHLEQGSLEGSIKQSRVFENFKYAVGRKRAIYELHNMIASDLVINVYGESGMGKTFLMHEYLFHASEANIYEFGIYYYSAPEIEENDDNIAHLIKEKINLLCEHYGTCGMRHANKESQRPKILFVFDDFLPNDFVKLRGIDFNNFFNKIEVCFIFISTYMVYDDALPFDMKYFTIDKLDIYEALGLILAIVDKRLFVYDKIYKDHILFGPIIRKLQGKPQEIVNAKFNDIKTYIDKFLPIVKNKLKKETKNKKGQAKKRKNK